MQPPVRAPESVMTCLKRALKIAHAAQQQLAVAMKTKDATPVLLFVDILNHYIYYFEQGLPTITPSVLQVGQHWPSPFIVFVQSCHSRGIAQSSAVAFRLHNSVPL